MYYGIYAPWEHYPKNLRHYEIQSPLSVIEEFFSCAWPKSHRRDLKEWRDYVINEKIFLDKKHGPSSVLFIHEINLKLLEALYLLWLDYEENNYSRAMPSEAQLEDEKEKWIYFPNNLSIKELLNPYKVVKKIFKKVSPQQFRDYLNDWLHWALSNSAIDETVVPGEVIMVYENILKLYSAAWVIHQREAKNGLAKVTKKTANEVCATERPPIELRSINPTLTAAEKLGLDELLNTIKTKIPSIQSITLLGTHEHPFTYYLLILLDEKEKIAEHELGNKIEDICRHHISVIAIVHKVNVARQGIENGKRFWNNIMSKGMSIYNVPDLQFPEFKLVAEDDFTKRAAIDWERWGLQGKSFLRGAKYYIENKDFTVAVFLLHQAAESTLIAIIKAILGYRMSAHNLSRMLRLTLLFTDELKNVFELNTTEGAQMFNLLQTAYSEARYRGSFIADEESVKMLIQKVEVFLDRAEMVYEQFVKLI